MADEFKFNNAFFDEVLSGPGVVQLVDSITEDVAADARSTAPVDSGEYRDGIVATGKFQKRYVGLVVGKDPKTMLIESQTGNLARAVQRKKRSRG